MAAAVQAIRRNMMRSALTMLGVFIGVAALIAMVAVGQGANDAVRKQIERLGTNLVVVLPGARTAGGMRAGSGSASTLTTSDAQAIRRESAAVSEVSYLIRQSGQVESGNQNWATSIQGISPNYPPIDKLADRRRTRDFARRRSGGGTRRRHRPDRFSSVVRRIAEPDRCVHPGQGRPVAGDRPARIQGADVIRPGPGRPGDDPVHHRRAQSARRGRAVPGADSAQLDLSERAQPLRPDAASGRLRQPDLRPGRQSDGRAARDQADHRDPRTPPSHQARRRQRFFRA